MDGGQSPAEPARRPSSQHARRDLKNLGRGFVLGRPPPFLDFKRGERGMWYVAVLSGATFAQAFLKKKNFFFEKLKNSFRLAERYNLTSEFLKNNSPIYLKIAAFLHLYI